ncbi:hypothetical protein GCM10012288_01980 [Malaciobacter pacificus]|uniref:Uncharacterized protein n=1 Tax=Malaciobacter pacificus TaxID=1080223 RepID=A0A5C2H7J9_9BACT|nr:cytochrome c [Malaciobacter pacificus]QEP33455.1 hypothetical protein APAC_0293 [Malaciobacter pacificus]GGD31627.1 hypothetical protein GCM10012288_01980 [Malaciobacter pacificus]
MNSLLKISLSTLALSTLTFAQTTMCFKENHTNLMTLEKVALDGGECNSQYSLTDMKNSGWRVDDIKINNNNYIYILKKGTTSTAFVNTNTNISQEELEKRVLAKLEAKQAQEKKEKEIEEKIMKAQRGQELYENKCQSCHGKKGELEPGLSVAINTLSEEDILELMDGYKRGTYSKGNPYQMRAYATTTTEEDTINIFNYLQSLK